jgi:hypothetical protein
VGAALFFSRQATKPQRGLGGSRRSPGRRCFSRAKPQSRKEVWGAPDDRRDAKVGRASRTDADGLEVADDGAFGELLAAWRLGATCSGFAANDGEG